MRNISFEALSAAHAALKHEIDELESLARDHAALGVHKTAAIFTMQAVRLEQAMGEISAAMGGAK